MRIIYRAILVGALATGGIAIGQPVRADTQTSSTLVAQALELLQKNEKQKALKILEKAFESAGDSQDLQQISILILEASPNNYPKREGYLQYLIKFAPDHEDAWRWYKEMGDRAFEHAKMDEAEDWYLRAKAIAKDTTVIQYKIGWVYWNLDRKVAAFENFLDVYATSDSGLKAQILKDCAKLWWEIGALPASEFERAMSLPDDARTTLLEHFIHSTPSHLEASILVEAQLNQLKSDPRSKEYFYRGLKSGFQFKSAPCFLFNSILTPEDEVSKDNFLACLKAKDRPPAEKLLIYFTKFENDADERIPWAEAELYVEEGRAADAVQILFASKNFNDGSKDFYKFTSQVVMKLTEDEFKHTYEMVGSDKFENLYLKSGSPVLLERLESVDAAHWLDFEEKSFKGKAIPKEFLLKKAVFLAQQSSVDLEALEKSFSVLMKAPLKGDEKKVSENYQRLTKRSSSKLPSSFSLQFKKKYDEWIADLDRSLAGLQSCSANWQIVARPIFQREVERNVDRLIAQIDEAQLDPKMEELKDVFEQKKNDLKADLRSKYLSAPGGGAAQ